MAKPETKGEHFVVEGRTLTIFGIKGRPHGEYWAISDPSHSVCFEPELAKEDIEGDIEQAREMGRKDVDIVCISAQTAICLWLEGALTCEMLAAAVETDTTVTVEVPLCGKDRKVVISAESNIFEIYDANGEPV